VFLADVSELTIGSIFIHLPMKMEPIVSSETSVRNTQTPGIYPKESKLHLEHGESLKSRSNKVCRALTALALRPVFLFHVRYVGMGITGLVVTEMTTLDMVCILQHLIVRMLITGTCVAMQQ
jgi:hypothetical protein